MVKELILAVVQGVTEFLPVSSSGHLVVFNEFLQANGDIFFYLSLHVGTTLALVLFFLNDILKYLQSFRAIKKILIVLVITSLIGLVGQALFEGMFDSSKMVAGFLVLNGLILIFANRKIVQEERDTVSYKDAFFLGIFQSLALIPGISRSGITISVLLARRVEREEAFRFSFVAAIPVVIGSFWFKAYINSITFSVLSQPLYLYSIITSFLVGYISLFVLSFVIKNAKLNIFGYYCLILSLYILWLS